MNSLKTIEKKSTEKYEKLISSFEKKLSVLWKFRENVIQLKKNRWKTDWNSKRDDWSRWKIYDYVTETHWISMTVINS